MAQRPLRLAAPVAVVASIIIMHALGWLAPIERWFLRASGTLTAPVARGTSSFKEWFKNLGTDIRSENDLLRAQVAVLEAERARLIAATEEVHALRTAQKIKSAAPLATVVARVLGSETGSGREMILIDRGARDGVAEGDPVLTRNGFLFGTIAEARETSSQVLLIFDAESRIAASVVEHPATIGVVEGGFGLVVRFGLVPLESELQVGDTVKTSAGGSRIPPGIFVGRVAQIRADAHTPFKSAVITPFESLASVSYLIVLQP